eukprot:Rmarinus@m.2871
MAFSSTPVVEFRVVRTCSSRKNAKVDVVLSSFMISSQAAVPSRRMLACMASSRVGSIPLGFDAPPTQLGIRGGGAGNDDCKSIVRRCRRLGSGNNGYGDNDDNNLSLWQQYNVALERNPLMTKAFTSAVMVGTGDVIAQLIELSADPNRRFDILRLLRMGVTGGVLIGPALHVWYGTLEATLGQGKLGGGAGEALAKIAADQLVYAPIFTAVVFAVLNALEGEGVAELKAKLGAPYVDTMKMNYRIWPLAQVVTFAVLPAHLRVLFANCVGLAWNVILSMLANQRKLE